MNNVQGATESKDSRLKAVYAWKAANEIKDIGKQFDKATGKSVEDKNGAFNISLSFGSQQQKSENTSQLRQAQGSNIQSDEAIHIKANAGNIDVVGSTVKGKTVDLEAGKDINMIAANNTSKETSTSSSSSTSFGVSMALNGTLFNPKLDASRASSNGNGDMLSHTNAKIIAQTELNLKAHQDLNMKGAQASAQKVNADVGRNLNIESLRDQDNYHEKTNSTSVGIAFGPGSGITGSNNRSKTDSDYASVTEQTGIYAGKDGFTINVKNNTDLKGAVIDSNATPDKNKLTTGTLTWSDVQNKTEYSASSTGIALDTRNKTPITPTPGIPVSGDANSTTKSGVALGSIITTGDQKQNIATLNRDPKQAINVLGKIFDKQTVKEQQQLATLFAQEANNLIHTISAGHQAEARKEKNKAAYLNDQAKQAESEGKYSYANQLRKDAAGYEANYNEIMKDWGEGGNMKTLLHGAVGGLTASFGGGDVFSGAASAAANEKAMGIMNNLDPNAQRLASLIIGGVVGKMTGGTQGALTGMATAENGTLYNRQANNSGDLVQGDIVKAWYGDGDSRNGTYWRVDYDSSGKLNFLPYGSDVPEGAIYWNQKAGGFWQRTGVDTWYTSNNLPNVNDWDFSLRYKKTMNGQMAYDVNAPTVNLSVKENYQSANATPSTVEGNYQEIKHSDNSSTKIGDYSLNLIGKIDSKENVVVQASAEGSIVHSNFTSDKIFNTQYGADLKLGNGEIWLPKLTLKPSKSEFVIGGEANIIKGEGTFSFKVQDYTITGKVTGAFGAGGRVFWEVSPTKLKGGINGQFGPGGGVAIEVEKKD